MIKLLFVGMLLVELLLVGTLVSPEFVHRKSFDRAFFAYDRDPTPEAKAKLLRERRIVQNIIVRDKGVIAMLLAANTFGLWKVLRRCRVTGRNRATLGGSE